MLSLKGKLKRLNGGMPRLDFYEWAQANSLRRGVIYSPQRVRALCAIAHRVKEEHAAEIAATIQMLCESCAITSMSAPHLVQTLGSLDLTAVRAYAYEGYTLAIETDKGWLVYPLNIRHVNWQLSHRRRA